MPGTYSYTNTYTFTQTEVVVSQFKIAIGYAGVLSKERTDLLLEAISNRQISSIGIDAYNGEHKTVAEVEICVDWDKHEQIISASGDIFDEGQSGFDYKKGEAAETKVFVHNFVKHAKEKGLNLTMWVITSHVTGEERERLLQKIGFGGEPYPWSGEIVDRTSADYKTVPQMRAGFSATRQF